MAYQKHETTWYEEIVPSADRTLNTNVKDVKTVIDLQMLWYLFGNDIPSIFFQELVSPLKLVRPPTMFQVLGVRYHC